MIIINTLATFDCKKPLTHSLDIMFGTECHHTDLIYVWNGPSNHWQINHLFNTIFSLTARQTSKLWFTEPFEKYTPVTGGFPPKGRVMRNTFPCHVFIIWMVCFTYEWNSLKLDIPISDQALQNTITTLMRWYLKQNHSQWIFNFSEINCNMNMGN